MNVPDDYAYWIGPGEPLVDLKNGDWRLGPLVFYRRKNPDGLVPRIVDASDGSGEALRLAVRSGAYDGPLDVEADRANDRCELREPAKSLLGAEIWYGFNIRIPADFPRKPLRFVVAQVKMPYDDEGNGSPAFSLRIDDGQWVATVEHLYEEVDAKDHRFLSTAVDGACGLPAAPAYDHHDFGPGGDRQVRAVLARDVAGLPEHLRRYECTLCTTGVKLATFGRLPPADGRWSDFILRIASSGVKDKDGVVELYADRELVARAEGELGFAREDAPPQYPQYFKVGPYRNNDPAWGRSTAAIELRDLRRGPRREDVDPPRPAKAQA